jgi:hypothetical protein
MRRDFLKLCGLAGLRLALPVFPSLARGEEKNDDEPYGGPYYVVFNASGGWDTTYLMDPKGVNEINRLYQEGEILTHGTHKYAPIKQHAQGGLCNEDFYAEFGDELLSMGWIIRSTTIRPAPVTWPPASSTAWPIPRSPRWSPLVAGQPARSPS